MKVGIFTRKIDGVMGGMEKQILLIASRLIESGHEVTVVSLDSRSPETFFARNSQIKFINVPGSNSDIKAPIKDKVVRQMRIFRVIREAQFDVVMSFSTGSLWYSVVPAKLNRAKVVLCERTGPSVYNLTRAKKYRRLIFLGMKLCDAIVVQMPSYIKSYPRILRNKIHVISNEVPVYQNVENVRHKAKILTFGFVGRLCHQKQSLQLVQAFLAFNLKYGNSQLKLIGNGEQKGAISDFIEDQKAHDVIKVFDSIPDIVPLMKDVDVLIHPSLWEGFPNGVAEALALGIPVAGFDDCEGLRDLVSNGDNGWLITRHSEVDSIIDLLLLVQSDRAKFELMGETARRSVQRYTRELAIKNWQQLLVALSDSRPKPT